MPSEFRNIAFMRAFVRNLDDLPNASRRGAERLQEAMESIVLARVESSNFLGGIWSDKQYSTAKIKAYKLGNAVVSGKGMNKELAINGITIDRDDWYWGSFNRDKDPMFSQGRAGVSPEFHGRNPGRPTPVFIPGYREWRVKYNGLSPSVNLDFRGNMLDNFEIDMVRTRGTNQYGSNWEFDLVVNEPFGDIAEITDYYRKWLDITEPELEEAIRESGASLSSILFK